MPALSLYPVPKACELKEWEVTLTGLAGERCSIGREVLRKLPRVREKSTLVCQIFNWSEEPEVEGVRLVDVLKVMGIDAPEDGYFSFHSADGLYFEGLPRAIARDPRTLLVFGLSGSPLPLEYGGPLRLWVPVIARLQKCEVAPNDSDFSERPRGYQEAARPKPHVIVGSRRPGQSGGGRSQTQQRRRQC